MECNKWQEEGLLYISKELDSDGSKEFQRHIETCPACRAEVEQYRFDAAHFFKESLIGESPSAEIDKKIIAACCRPPKMTAALGLFSGLWLKKAFISIVFLIFGMSAGVYFTVNYFTGSSPSALVSSAKKPSAVPAATKQAAGSIAAANINDTSLLRKKDSLKRSEPASLINGDHSTGPQRQGIITVDVKKE